MLSFVCATLAGWAALPAADWNMYLHDVAHTSSNAAESILTGSNIGRLSNLWSTSLHAPLASGSTIVNGVLYLGAWDGNFYAIDAATGAILWKQNLGVAPNPFESACGSGLGVTSQAVVSGNNVYVGGGDSALYALDRATGAIRNRVPLADPALGSYLWSSLTLSKNRLYIGVASLDDCPTVRGALVKLDLANITKPVFKYLLPATLTGAGVWSTPAVDEVTDTVFVTTGNADNQDAASGQWGSAMLALNANTLDIQSYFFLPINPVDVDVDWGSSPLLFNRSDGTPMVAASGKDGNLYARLRADLSFGWTLKMATSCVAPEQGCGSVSTPAFDGKTIFAGSGDSALVGNAPVGTVYAVNPDNGQVIWKHPTDGVVIAPVTVAQNMVFTSTTNGLRIFDGTTGTEIWNDRQHGALYSQPTVLDGVVYSSYLSGDIIARNLGAVPDPPSVLLVNPLPLTFVSNSEGDAPAQTVTAASSSASVDVSVTANSSGWLAATASGGTTPATVTISVSAAGLATGSYTGSVTLASSAAASGAVIPITLVVGDPISDLSPSNVGDAATFQGSTFAPGSLFTISAAHLASATAFASQVPLPTLLGGVSVSVNGVPAPLLYVSPTQVNAQIPFGLSEGTASLEFTSDGQAAAPLPISVVSASPSIFLAQNPDGSVNSSTTPVRSGDTVVAYFTGQGAVDHAIASGDAAPSSPLSNTRGSTTVTIGGQRSAVSFSGLTPGFVGLAQVNVHVPNLGAGNYPLVLSVGNAASNPITLWVRHAP